MTCKAAYRRLGMRNVRAGINRAAVMADTASSAHGIRVDIVPHENEDDPSDNWLNVILEYKTENEHAYMEALANLRMWFGNHGLSLDHECSGDGSLGIIESFRVN